MADIQEIPIEAEDVPETTPDIHEDIPEQNKIFREIFQKKDEAVLPGRKINPSRSQLPSQNLKQSKRSK